jgi:glycine/D-amino acid oxidase-like deaminating enzyme
MRGYTRSNDYTHPSVLYTDDYISEPSHFLKSVLEKCRSQGVVIKMNRTVSSFVEENKTIKSLQIRDVIKRKEESVTIKKTDVVVVAAGTITSIFIPDLPVMHVFGITRISKTDKNAPCGAHIQNGIQNVILPETTRLVTGAIFTRQIRPSTGIINSLMKSLPYKRSCEEDFINARIVSPDGLPIVGKLSNNLYVSTGQGFVGYTLACWCGEMLANSITGKGGDVPACDPSRFLLMT